MCMYEDCDERAQVLGERYQKARKEHRCSECARVIKPGEKYLVEFIKSDDVEQIKTCSHCEIARDWLSAECGGWVYTAIEEDVMEHAQSGYYGKDVKRLAVGMRRMWTTVKGTLMPLPKLPATTHQTTTT